MMHQHDNGMGGLAIRWEQQQRELMDTTGNCSNNLRARYKVLLKGTDAKMLSMIALHVCDSDNAQAHESITILDVGPEANGLLYTSGIETFGGTDEAHGQASGASFLCRKRAPGSAGTPRM